MRVKILGIALLLMASALWAQADNEEFRATWVITWEHISASSSVDQNQARIRTIMDNHVAANMTSVLFQVRQGGTAYYNSSYEPWGSYAGGSYPGFDPLEYAIEQAHLRGLELHAWFNTFQAQSTVPGAPSAEHPEWVCRDGEGNPMPTKRALSPGLAEVREYTLNVAMEIVNNYDIDGIHLDYIRWNEYNINNIWDSANLASEDENKLLDGQFPEDINESGLRIDSEKYLYDIDHPYSAGVPAGYDSWPEFWRSSVTAFVQSLHDSIQTQKPWVRLSAAALGKYNWTGWNGYDVVYQDAALWFNEGYIDQLTPMHYHWTTSQSFVGMLAYDSPYCWADYIQPGIAAGRLFSAGPGSYILARDNIWNRHPGIVLAARNIPWVDGFQFFSYGSWQDYQYWPSAGASFFSRKTKVRASGAIVDETPATPTVALAVVDSLTFDISITPDASVEQAQWWALYRSLEDNIQVDASDLVGVYFGDSAFTVTEQFDGTQDHNSSYFYSATMLDRYWNESLVAASVETSPLPSLAPVVTSVYPAHNDTVEINTLLTIQFSKTMNVASVEAALSFTPEVAIDHYTWTEDDHRIIIYPEADFDYASVYTMMLTDDAMDINGAAFDGDADGVAGGDLSLTFYTKAVDEAGPEVLYSDPEVEIGSEAFDIDAPLSFVFNELVDASTVNLDAIQVTQGGEPVEVDFLLSGFYGKSVLDIRPFSSFSSATNYLLVLDTTITDGVGNAIEERIEVPFTTFNKHYSLVTNLESFNVTGEWWDPEGSGSTAGTIGATTTWGYSSSVFLPGSGRAASQRRSGSIAYEWDTSASAHLLREYIPHTAAPATRYFDTSYILQCWVYGDASMNLFRFAIDEGDGTDWNTSEVSTWYTLDWEGWRLVEWDLSDPDMVGTWIGNGILDGSTYRMDSFQIDYDTENGAVTGRIFLDNLRVVQRAEGVTIDEDIAQLPSVITLHPNYPNPFNPETTLSFSLPEAMEAKLAIFDIRGRYLETIDQGNMTAGLHSYSFDAGQYAAGVFLVVLSTETGTETNRILLLK